MGDRRFEPAYQKLRGDKGVENLASMTDTEVISALAAASRAQDPYLANVLATAAHNRLHRASAVVANIGEGLCSLDRTGTIIQANPAAVELLGLPEAHLVGREFHRVAHAFEGELCPVGAGCPLSSMLAQGASQHVEDFFAREAHRFPVSVTLTPIIVDGEVEGHVVLFRDDTVRKQAEERIRDQTRVLESAIEKSLLEIERRADAEEKFRQLFDAAPDPVIVTDAHDKVVALNARALLSLGYGPEAAGIGVEAIILDEGREGAETFRWDRVKPSNPVRIRRRDGSMFPAEASTSRIFAATGNIRVTTLRDITSRARQEALLRRREALLKDAESLAQLGSWEWEPATGEVTWSDQMFRLYGLEPKSAGVNVDSGRSRVYPDDRAELEEKFHRAMTSGESFTYEHRILRADGKVRNIHAHATFEKGPSGEITRVVGTAQDVTEEREANEALRRTEGKFDQVVESLAESIVLLRPSGSIAYANGAARTHDALEDAIQAGWVTSLVGKLRLQDGSAVEDLPHGIKEIMAGTPVKDVAIEVDDSHGSQRSLIVNAVPFTENQVPTGAIVSFHDVTALEIARREYRGLNAELERKLQEKTRRLEDANRELQAFAYTVSHDLLSPFRAIDFLVGTLGETLQESDPAWDSLKMMRREVGRGRQLVHDLLALSTVTGGELVRKPVDLADLARTIGSDLKAGAPARDAEIVIDASPKADVDEGLMRILLANLMGNAWKYTSKVERSARIEVGYDRDKAAYFVRDNGVGFDPARAPRLFEPFQRYHSTQDYEGTGIGLATVSRIVRRHGGRIWVESAPGKGGTFFFTLGPDSEHGAGGTGSAPPTPRREGLS